MANIKTKNVYSSLYAFAMNDDRADALYSPFPNVLDPQLSF